MNEQAQPSPAIDVYGLGALFYALVTRQPPVAGESWAAFVAALERTAPGHDIAGFVLPGSGLGEYISTMLAMNPADRPGSAAAVAAELERYCSPICQSGRPPNSTSRRHKAN